MTTLQPRLVRADTLDLQSHKSPSAKDHTRSPAYSPYGHGAAGAHLREALRNAEENAYNDQTSHPHAPAPNSRNGTNGQTHLYDSADEDDAEDEQHEHMDGNVQHDGEYENGEIEDEDDMDDDLMDKISSSPSIEDEDIDFEFVYALHTFVATVEGQANATKGDTMVLLDDSNSYWWLVRVVKDGSIGYLPAEHIETPTERLARLNKHRNIDLAASMLSDNPEKSKNPLKKAMRRRNAKSVAFTAPTYYEPSEYNYSSDEDDNDEELDSDIANQQQQQATSAATEEIIIADNTHDVATNGGRKMASEDRITMEPTSPIKADAPDSEAHAQQDENFQRTRNGVVRNTDSFFKDDTAETKKISLTPRLLRGDSETAPVSPASQPMSTDTFDKLLGDDKGGKDEKKKKEKKGMLSGFFKRKDKKSGKSDADDLQSPDDALASPTSKDSMESVSNSQLTVERKTSKLQKTPPTAVQSKSSSTDLKTASANSSLVNSPTTAAPPQTLPAHVPQDTAPQQPRAALEVPVQQTEQSHTRAPSHTDKKSIFAPITTVLKSTPAVTEDENTIKPVYSKRAKERFAIDTSDSDEDGPSNMKVPAPARHSISPMLDTELHKSRPDSAMQVSPIDSADERDELFHMGEKSISTDEEVLTPTERHGQSDTASTSKPSPSLATHTPSTSRSTPTWSDASLRSYMDNDQDIRDLLIIIHDKSNVTPIGPDHPLMGGLFTAERTRLAEMQAQLDTMLTSWMSKKNPSLLAK